VPVLRARLSGRASWLLIWLEIMWLAAVLNRMLCGKPQGILFRSAMFRCRAGRVRAKTLKKQLSKGAWPAKARVSAKPHPLPHGRVLVPALARRVFLKRTG
jgi:hypothetical protein